MNDWTFIAFARSLSSRKDSAQSTLWEAQHSKRSSTRVRVPALSAKGKGRVSKGRIFTVLYSFFVRLQERFLEMARLLEDSPSEPMTSLS